MLTAYLTTEKNVRQVKLRESAATAASCIITLTYALWVNVFFVVVSPVLFVVKIPFNLTGVQNIDS